MTYKKTLIVFLLAMFASIYTQAQTQQEGQTFLFKCISWMHPDTSVSTLIQRFEQFTGTHQDVYQDGARATVQQTIDYIASQCDTVDVRRMGVIKALQDHLRILTVVHLTDDDGNSYDHEIVLVAVKGKDLADPSTVKLLYYNPATGRIEEIRYIQWVKTISPRYVIPIKG
jgi:hypothetical protein